MAIDVDSLTAAYRAAPGLDAQSLYGASQSAQGDPGQAASNAQAIEGFGNATQFKNYLSQMDPSTQRTMFNRLSGDERNMLGSAGYKPPAPSGEGGLFGFIHHVASDVGHVASAVPSALAHGFGDVANALGAPIREVQRGIRAGIYVANDLSAHPEAGALSPSGNNFRPGTGWSNFFSPSEWATAWRSVKNGEQTFNPGIVRQLSQRYDQGTLNMAMRVASATSDNFTGGNRPNPNAIAAITKGMDPATAQATVDRIQHDPTFGSLVSQLVASKLNFGNFLVGERFHTQHPELARVLGGAANAVTDWYGDPLIAAGKATKALNVSRYVVANPEDVARLYTAADPGLGPVRQAVLNQSSQNVRAGFQAIADHLRVGDVDGLIRAQPKLAPIAPVMATATVDGEKLHTPDAVAKWFAGQVGFRAFMEGKAGGMTSDYGKVLPSLSSFQRAGIAAKDGFRQTVNWAAESPRQVVEQIVNSPLSSESVAEMDKLGKDIETLTGTHGLLVEGGHTDLAPKIADRIAAKQDRLSALGQDLRQALQVREPAQVGLMGRVLRSAGKTTQSLTRLVPESTAIDASDPAQVTTVQRLADLFLPADTAKQFVNLWAASDTLGPKRSLFKGLLDQMFTHAGLNADADTQQWAARFLDRLDAKPTSEMYSSVEDAAGRIDVMANNGADAAGGFLHGHGTTTWSFPSFRDLLAHSTRASATRAVFGKLNNDMVNWFMDSVWKPLLLVRLGFPIRAGGEELFGALLRHSPLALARSRLAASAVLGDMRGSEDRILPWHPIRHYTSHLPDGAVQKAVQGPSEFVAQVLGDRTRRAFRNVEGRLAGERYVDAVRRGFGPAGLGNAMAEEVSATHNHALGFVDSPETRTMFTKQGAHTERVSMVPTGAYKGYQPADPLYLHVYRKDLDEIAGDGWARTALEHFDAPHDEQVRHVADAIEGDGVFAKRFARYYQDRAGRQVGSEITQRQALEDWADVVVKHVDGLLRDPAGVELGDLRQFLLDNKEAPALPFFNDIPEGRLPLSVKGPEVLPRPISKWNDMIQRGFDGIVGRPMNWMVRQPLWIHNFALELKNSEKGLLRVLGDNPNTEKIIADTAAEAATRRTLPYIHNPQLKSQVSVYTRNLAPFWFAQEQFYKRWVHNFAYAPEAFRKAQLMVGGLRHFGFIQTDDQGNDYFNYPVVGQAVQDVVARGMELMTGHKIQLPVPVGFTGDVKFVSPGLERLGVPSFGPLVSIPMKLVTDRFPELQPAEQGLLGRGAGTSLWEQLVPTTLARIAHVFDSPNSSPQYASAMIQAIQYLTANGMMPPKDASPQDLQAFVDRVKNWTRTIFLTRTVLGFAAPASPTINLDPKKLGQQFRELLTQMPYEQALAEFIRQNPDATPYTVFPSKTAGGQTIPATAEAEKWMVANRELIAAYPAAAAWLIPQAPGKYDQAAYAEQLALGMRERRAPADFLNELIYSASARDYFDSEARYKQAVKGARGQARTALTTSWEAWKQQYLAANPVFSDMLQASTAALQRQQTLEQLTQALGDPRAPGGALTGDVRDLVESYNRFHQYDATLSGQTSTRAAAARKGARQSFNEWVGQFIVDHPDTQPLYQRLIAPEVPAS